MKDNVFQIGNVILWNVIFLIALVVHFMLPIREYSYLLYREKSWFTVVSVIYILALIVPFPITIWKLVKEEEYFLRNLIILSLCVVAAFLGVRICYLYQDNKLLQGEMEVLEVRQNEIKDGCIIRVITTRGEEIEVLCSYEDFKRLKPGFYEMSILWNWNFPDVGILENVYVPITTN